MTPPVANRTLGSRLVRGLLQVHFMNGTVTDGDRGAEGAPDFGANVGGGPIHEPVMPREVLEYLDVRADGVYVDATVGTGGHASSVLERLGSEGRLIGLDRDAEVLPVARRRLEGVPSEGSFELHHADFSALGEVLDGAGESFVDGILADLGMSSWQLGQPERGFSHSLDGPLDMRLDRSTSTTAEELLNDLPETELARLIYRYGEEPRSRLIAAAVARRRRESRISRTSELADLVRSAVSPPHEADALARTFQALRIAVNEELRSLEALLREAPRWLGRGGRLVIVSFHSLEDRQAKQALVRGERAGIFEVLTEGPVRPSASEVDRNPRSRSARLRAARKLLATGGNLS